MEQDAASSLGLSASEVNLTPTIEFHSNSVENIPYDPDAKPIWEIAAMIAAKVPEEEWEKLPTDLAENFRNYQGHCGHKAQ